MAAELQKKSLGIWLCDDDYPDDQSRPVKLIRLTSVWEKLKSIVDKAKVIHSPKLKNNFIHLKLIGVIICRLILDVV